MRILFALWILFGSLVWGEGNGTAPESVGTKEIMIQGNQAIETSAYLDALGVKQRSWFAFWKEDKTVISIKLIPRITDTMRAFLDSKGFYDARISVKTTAEKVIVQVDEDQPVRISSIEIQSDFNLSHIITFQEGGRFEAATFTAIKQKIKEALMKAGYCHYQLDTKAYVDLDTRKVALQYRVEKGALCYFGETVIASKPDTVSERVIRSRLRYKKGEVFDTEKITHTFDALNSLDAFGSGTVAPKEEESEEETVTSQTVPMEISLSQKEKLNLFKGGVGYDTALGMRLQLYYERRNFLGDARKVTSTLQYADNQQNGEVTLFSPALVFLNGSYMDFYSKVGYSHTIYDAYNEDKGYWTLKLSYERERMIAEIGMGLENIDIEKRADDPSIIGGNFLLFYPFINVVYDGRDSKINPKNGYYFSAYAEYGLDYKPDASSYLKYLLEGRLIKSLGDLTVATVGKIGVIDEFAGIVPASKLFYAGGAYSNRAYGEYDIGYITSPVSSSDLGGKTWLNLSVEADYPLYEKLYGALFFDSTMITEESYDFKGETINSVGVGVRYMTPVGPLKVDIGANIDDFNQYGISFQIGQSF